MSLTNIILNWDSYMYLFIFIIMTNIVATCHIISDFKYILYPQTDAGHENVLQIVGIFLLNLFHFHSVQ